MLMGFDLIRVCIFTTPAAPPSPDYLGRITHTPTSPYAASGFDASLHDQSQQPLIVFATRRPQVIVSFGPPDAHPGLLAAPLELRKRWLSYATPPDPRQLAADILNCFLTNVQTSRFAEEPLVSVFTPAYRTGPRLHRTFKSVRDQTYTNWEWVVYDDSDDADVTFAELASLQRLDPRVKAFRGAGNCGMMGEVKRRAAALCTGQILVELDHDDELHEHCLALIVGALRAYPDAGFAYTDWSEMIENGQPVRRADGWAGPFITYRTERWRGQDHAVVSHAGLCSLSLRTMMAGPHHVRAWRRDVYEQVGGYHPDLHVFEDAELVQRTFMATRMVHIPRLGYLQWHNVTDAPNTSARRQGEIRRMLDLFQRKYNPQIHQRLLDLGVDDYACRDGIHVDNTARPAGIRPLANYTFRP
jgi:O-antigen biosynthesis protein